MFKRIKILLVILFLYFMFVQQPAYVFGQQDTCEKCMQRCSRQYEKDMKKCSIIKNETGRVYCEYAADRALEQCQIMCQTGNDCNGGGGGPSVICWPNGNGGYSCIQWY